MDKENLIMFGIGPAVVALCAASLVLVSFGLSATALPFLVKCGIIGSIFPALYMIFSVGKLLYDLYKGNKIEDSYKSEIAMATSIVATSVAIGVGIGTTLNPGGVLAASGIGITAPLAALALVCMTVITANVLNEHIVSPVIEGIKGRFSSMEGDSHKIKR